MEKYPSLQHKVRESFADQYRHAVRSAVIETALADSRFPEQCPWSYDQVMEDGFLP